MNIANEGVVKIKIAGGLIVQNCTLYIGRECHRGGWNLQRSKWYNPYTISQCGSAEAACIKYEEHIRSSSHLWNSLWELEGHTLGCWCHPDPCHGHVLLRLLNEQRMVYYMGMSPEDARLAAYRMINDMIQRDIIQGHKLKHIITDQSLNISMELRSDKVEQRSYPVRDVKIIPMPDHGAIHSVRQELGNCYMHVLTPRSPKSDSSGPGSDSALQLPVQPPIQKKIDAIFRWQSYDGVSDTSARFGDIGLS